MALEGGTLKGGKSSSFVSSLAAGAVVAWPDVEVPAFSLAILDSSSSNLR